MRNDHRVRKTGLYTRLTADSGVAETTGSPFVSLRDLSHKPRSFASPSSLGTTRIVSWNVLQSDLFISLSYIVVYTQLILFPKSPPSPSSVPKTHKAIPHRHIPIYRPAIPTTNGLLRPRRHIQTRRHWWRPQILNSNASHPRSGSGCHRGPGRQQGVKHTRRRAAFSVCS